MPKIRYWLDYGYAGIADVEEEAEVDDAEWGAMSPQQRDTYCRNGWSDFIGNHIDSGWSVEGEES